MIESQSFQNVIVGFIVVAVLGTLISVFMLWRSVRQPRLRPA
jgi:ABC-type nitrate/sulfonate/bicarbonate transport system permease component